MVLDVVVIVLFLFYAIVQFVGKNKVKQSQSDMEDLLKEGLYQLERNQNIVASNIESKMYQSMTEASQLQQNYLSQISHSNQETVYQMMDRVDTKLELVRTTLDQKLHDVEVKNEANLEKIRMTVDEKLHETLEQRLGKSFQLVSERLEQVHRGLGEVNLLAEGVGDLKKVLTNVKLRDGRDATGTNFGTDFVSDTVSKKYKIKSQYTRYRRICNLYAGQNSVRRNLFTDRCKVSCRNLFSFAGCL